MGSLMARSGKLLIRILFNPRITCLGLKKKLSQCGMRFEGYVATYMYHNLEEMIGMLCTLDR